VVKPKDSGSEEVWRARLMDKVDCVERELKLIKYLIGVICLIELFNMLRYCARFVQCCNEKRMKMNEYNPYVKIFPSNWSLNCLSMYQIDPYISEKYHQISP